MRKINGLLLLGCALMSLFMVFGLTGCGSKYKEGVVINGNYYNNAAGFKIMKADGFNYTTTADDSLVFLDNEQMKIRTRAITGEDLAKIEYAAYSSKSTTITVYSEKNVKAFTAQGYADRLASFLEKQKLKSTIVEDKDININGVDFRLLEFSNDLSREEYLITIVDDKVVYINITASHKANDDMENALNSISAYSE